MIVFIFVEQAQSVTLQNSFSKNFSSRLVSTVHIVFISFGATCICVANRDV